MSDKKECIVKIEHLKKEYPNITPLKDVTVDIYKGDVISVIGPSGTGKSTLLRCINRLEIPTSGKIFFKNEEITDPKCKMHKIRQKMGMVFQSFNLFENLNIIENIMAAPVKLLGKTRKEAYNEGMQLLRRVGLAEKALNLPSELSGGQKQRVAIARAIAMKPEILLFDEPTSALDPTMVGEVLQVIKKLADEGMSMMIVTHEMKFAKDVSNRVFYMDEGGIFEDGTPDQIFNHPQKDKTRVFIKRLKQLTLHINNDSYDFIGITSKIEHFGRDNYLSQKHIRNIQLVFEEIVTQNIVPYGESYNNVFPINVIIEYSDANESISMDISYGGMEFNPFKEGDNLSSKLISKLASKVEHKYKNSENKISISFE